MKRIARNSLPLVFLVAAVVLVAGTGAFSAIGADRTASIGVAGDDSALLAITPHPSADPGIFGGGETFSLTVSQDSTTTYSKLFVITNQGTQSVAVWINDTDYHGGSSGDLAGDIIGNLDEDNTGNVTLFNSSYGGASSCENGVKSLEDQENAVNVPTGGSLVVGILADADDVSDEEADLLDEITIHADASVDGWDMTSTTPSCN